jgi:nicotinamidase-related amidase
MAMPLVEARPAAIDIDPGSTALLVIDMQRDFLEPGGFGAALGNDVSQLARVVAPCRDLLRLSREAGLAILHTREGHRPDLSDAPRAKLERAPPGLRIGDPGPMGRILIRGEKGHEIVPDLAPEPGEPVIDKPGKGAFYQTDLELMLRNRGVDTLLVAGVTTEVCVHTTVREANDRGLRCIVVADCCGSYFPEFHAAALAMVSAQGGIFGWVSDVAAVRDALAVPAAATGTGSTR